MVTIRRKLAGWMGCLILGLSASTAFGQVPDVFLDLPPVNINFNGIVEFGPDAQSITNAHDVARQQVRLALAYLTANRDRILAGLDPLYNAAFGEFYDRTNPFIGQYNLFIEGYRLYPFALFGSFAVTAGENTITNTDGTVQADVHLGYTYLLSGFESGIAYPFTIFAFDEEDENTMLSQEIAVEDGSELIAFQIIGTEMRLNTSHYDQVVATYERIALFLDQNTTYSGNFNQELYDAVFGPGVAPFLGFGRDFRQDGLSNSNSPTHLDQLLNDPANPLFWTQDNVEFLDDNGNPLPADRIYFNEHLTIFGENDNPNNQTVGQSFLDEEQNFAGDFFDGNVSNRSAPTEFSQWQMITQSFAESSTNINQQGVAGFGVQEIYNQLTGGAGSPQFLQNKDAGQFAGFADLFKDVGLGGMGVPDFTPRKRATAADPPNFSPFVQFAPIIPDTNGGTSNGGNGGGGNGDDGGGAPIPGDLGDFGGLGDLGGLGDIGGGFLPIIPGF